MKFTIKVDEFWLRGEELEEALVSRIKTNVVKQIEETIEDKVLTQITEKVSAVIDDKICQVIDSTITDLIATERINTGSKNQPEIVAIKDHIKSLFDNHRGWNSVSDQIKRIADKFCEQVKIQYNNAFANHIVKGMKEQGLLKDEVVQILLEGKK